MGKTDNDEFHYMKFDDLYAIAVKTTADMMPLISLVALEDYPCINYDKTIQVKS